MKVGIYGIGLDTYWPQFAGLREKLTGNLHRIAAEIDLPGEDVVNLGLIDSPEKAREAGDHFHNEGIELLFLYISTYALSSTVLPVVQRAGVPVIVLNIQSVPAINYNEFNELQDRGKMTGEWLAHCQACCVPEIASVLKRAEIHFELVTGHFEDQETWAELNHWVTAARVRKGMRDLRLGVMGHYYAGMLDVYSDMTAISSIFGTHFDLIEIDELIEVRNQVSETDAQSKVEEFRSVFQVADTCNAEELKRAARTSVALDRLAESHALGTLTYYYEGQPGNGSEDVMTSMIAGSTLLTGNHVPVAGECEIKNAHAMKIMDLIGCGGSFSEFYAMDFDDDIILLGHDGPAHFAIAEGDVGLVPLPVFHGKPGKGLSIQMTVTHGPVTLLSVCQDNDGIFLLCAEGESVPGPVLNIGNTNSRYRFALSPKEFIENWSKAGPSHHCAVGTGHVAAVIEKTATLLGIPCTIVC